MKKSDLKTGMIVELQNGYKCVVYKDICETICSCSKNSKDVILIIDADDHLYLWVDLKDYTDDMIEIDEHSGDFDIMKVFIPYHPYSFMDIEHEEDKMKLIWEREEPVKEITMKELEEHFGCRVKIIEN